MQSLNNVLQISSHGTKTLLTTLQLSTHSSFSHICVQSSSQSFKSCCKRRTFAGLWEIHFVSLQKGTLIHLI